MARPIFDVSQQQHHWLHDPRYRFVERRRHGDPAGDPAGDAALLKVLFPEVSKAEHARLAKLYAAQAVVVDAWWKEAVIAAETKYGTKGQHEWILGVPAEVRAKVTHLAEGLRDFSRAARAHWKASGKRTGAPHLPAHQQAWLTERGPHCAYCHDPIFGPPSTVHTPGKPDELYHPNHLQYRER